MNLKPVLILLVLFTFITNAQQISTKVSTLSELKSRVEKAKSGEVIILEQGILEGDPITIKGTGSAQKPIKIVADEKNKTILKSALRLEGEYLILQGLQITDNGALEVSGKGCRICACKWSDSKSGKWIRVLPGSSEIEIDHNTFENKTSNKDFERGCQLMQVVVRNKNERHHIHHNYFKDVWKGRTGNGFETLQLITENNPFDPPPGNCNTIIEHNLFERCNGEAEIISIKSNGNRIQRNTFLNCRGSLVLRHGDNNSVAENYFDGKNEPGSGGIRIQGADQVVCLNYFSNLGQFGLGMMDGTPDDLYIRVERGKIVLNSFINCNKPMVIGLNHSKHPNGSTPKDCIVAGNLFYYDPPNSETVIVNLVQNDHPENWTWEKNIAYGAKVGETIGGVRINNPNLHLHENGWYVPTAKTPVATFSDFTSIATEKYIPDNRQKNERVVGAIFYPADTGSFNPTTAKDVGVESF